MSILTFRQNELERKNPQLKLLEQYRATKKHVEIGGVNLSYMDSGAGLPILFIHSNFSSSFTWRKVIAGLSGEYRCIAIDLLGVGDTKFKRGYSYEDFNFSNQQMLLDELLNKILPDQEVILVVQGSGSVYGCEWAYRNKSKIKGLVHTAGIFTDMSFVDNGADKNVELYKTGIDMIESNEEVLDYFIKDAAGCDLSDEEYWEYSRSFVDEQGMFALRYALTDLLSLEGALPHIVSYTSWIANSNFPKLMFSPSNIFPSFNVYKEKAEKFGNQTLIELQSQLFVQEEKPQEFLTAFKAWVKSV